MDMGRTRAGEERGGTPGRSDARGLPDRATGSPPALLHGPGIRPSLLYCLDPAFDRIPTPDFQMPRSLDPLFSPRSIAVIGASRRPGTIGWQIVDNLLRHGFEGSVYPVNPSARSVHSVPAWRSVREIPGEVDLAIIVVPKELVLQVVDECGEKGVSAIVVISAGFREVGGKGEEREARLMERVRRYGMRLVGPNCMGVLNTAEDVRMNATFAPTMPPAGPVSFLSQSGALGVTILDYAAEYGIGIRSFVSVGNKPDVSSNDVLEYWEADPGTRVILMYLETFGNPRHFTRIARRVARKKPIIVVKSGRTLAGARAASSHTGSLSGKDSAADALLAQCGVLRADTVEEVFDLAMAFGVSPLPAGNRVAIVTNAGGPGIIIADACEGEGLQVAEFSPETLERLHKVFPEEASVRNPVDMVASATAESYRVALEIVLEDPGVDAAIAAFVPPLGIRQSDVAQAIVAAHEGHRDTPILAVLMGRDGLPEGRAELQAAGIPAYIFPESAARALGAMDRHRRWVERPVQAPTRFPVEREEVRQIIEGARSKGRSRLLEHEAYRVLEGYGIPVVRHGLVRSEDEAVQVAAEIDGPVVLKVVSADIVHKTELGGVVLELEGEEEVRSGWTRLQAAISEGAPDAAIEGILVAEYRTRGRELILGMNTDPSFGPVLMFGLGGIYVETFRDVAFRLPPVTEMEAGELIREIRSFPILEGVRGEEGVCLDSVTQAIQRLSQLVLDHPALESLDVNPFLATPGGGVALDARIALVQ
ncbi:MAG: CoA-binding protein [Gemmatimonadales bacterium]|nr:MAG: CoA-binding protein [Gemmatimonadales bacterium]